MRLVALFVVLILSFSSVASANSCPLSNPVYKNLRAAAAALEQKVLLPQGCEELAKKLNEANQQISSSANAMLNMAPGSSGGQSSAAAASQGIMQVGNIFSQYGKTSDRCGKALVSMSDYIVAFIDTVNGISPLLLSFGGEEALPYAMGATILGSAIKTFITYYQGLTVDMTTSQARTAFIENACGYYQFNELVRSLLQTLKGEVSEQDRIVERLRQELKAIEADAAPAPQLSEQIAQMDAELKVEQSEFADFKALFERVLPTAPALACSLVRTQVEASQSGSFPTPTLQRMDLLVKLSESEKRAPNADRYLLEAARMLNRSDRYTAVEYDAQLCAARARDWVSAIGELLVATERQLSQVGRRDLSQTDAGKLRKAWEERQAKKKSELTAAEQRQKFLVALAQRGADIELSELLDSRDRMRRELFGDGADSAFFGLTHRKGPAESWLRHKWRSSGVQAKDFRLIMPFFRKSWLDQNVTTFPEARQKEFACAYAENAVLTWNTADRHVAASRLFCESFEQTINKATHPYVTEFCLGTFSSTGQRMSYGKIAERNEEVQGLKPEVERILAWMKNAGCAVPKPFEGVLN